MNSQVPKLIGISCYVKYLISCELAGMLNKFSFLLESVTRIHSYIHKFHQLFNVYL